MMEEAKKDAVLSWLIGIATGMVLSGSIWAYYNL
jgi:hypothetical protein